MPSRLAKATAVSRTPKMCLKRAGDRFSLKYASMRAIWSGSFAMEGKRPWLGQAQAGASLKPAWLSNDKTVNVWPSCAFLFSFDLVSSSMAVNLGAGVHV